MAKEIIITEQLAQALLTCLRLGTFPIQYAQVKEVDTALVAAVKAAGEEIVEGSPNDAKEQLVEAFPGGVIE